MSNDSRKLQAIVIHGSGDRAESLLRGRAMAVRALMSETSSSAMEILDARIDLAIVFSGSKTMGADSPSEAELMYQAFAKRLGILKARMKRLGIPVPDVIDVPSRPDGKKVGK